MGVVYNSKEIRITEEITEESVKNDDKELVKMQYNHQRLKNQNMIIRDKIDQCVKSMEKYIP